MRLSSNERTLSQYQYYKNRLADLQYPHVCLDVDLLDKNIQANLGRAGDKKIRLASKSIRCVEVLKYIFETHDAFQGIMAYHGAEVLFLIEHGFDDILLGYPVVDKSLIEQLTQQIKIGKQICFMVDSIEHLALLNSIAKQENCKIPVCLDLDVSDNYPGLRFGVWRSSVQTQDHVIDFEAALQQFPNIYLDGLMAYEAQVAGVGDATKNGGIKNTIIKQLKKRSIPRIAKKRQEAVEYLIKKGHALRFVNGGGTGSLESTQAEDCVSEVTVGSGFYNSHLFDNYAQFQFESALFYAIQIVRNPEADIYTCHGGGFIASGNVEPIKAPIIHLPKYGQLDSLEGAGEVQTPIRFLKQTEQLQIGDPIYLRHAKAGELLERFNSVYLLKKDFIKQVPTYRGEGYTFG